MAVEADCGDVVVVGVHILTHRLREKDTRGGGRMRVAKGPNTRSCACSERSQGMLRSDHQAIQRALDQRGPKLERRQGVRIPRRLCALPNMKSAIFLSRSQPEVSPSRMSPTSSFSWPIVLFVPMHTGPRPSLDGTVRAGNVRTPSHVFGARLWLVRRERKEVAPGYASESPRESPRATECAP